MTDESLTDGESIETEESKITQDDAVREILKGAGVIYAGLFLNMGIAFVAQRFAAVHLSVDGFGSLLSGTALLDIGAIVAGLGLASGLTRYFPRIKTQQQRSLALYSFLFVVPISLLVAVPIVIFADTIATNVFNDPNTAISIRIFAAVIPFAAVLNLAIGGIRGQMVSRFQVYIENILHPTLRFGLIIIAVVIGAGQEGFAAGYAAPYIVGAVIAVGLLWRILPEGNLQASRTILPEVIRYSLPFTITGLGSFIYRSIDIFLILYFLDSRAVGIYGVAYALAQLISMFSTAFDYLSTPVSSQLESDDRVTEAVTVQETIARWTVIATTAALVPLSMFATDYLELIYRPVYATAGSVLVIIAAGFAINNVLQTNNSILKAIGKSTLTAINTSVASVVNIILNLFLIPKYGIEGAAIATFVSYVILGFLPTVEVWYYTRMTSLSRHVVAPAAVSIPITIGFIPLFRAVPNSLLWILSASSVFIFVYVAAIIVLLGLRREDVMVIRSVEDEYGIPLGPVRTILRHFS